MTDEVKSKLRLAPLSSLLFCYALKMNGVFFYFFYFFSRLVCEIVNWMKGWCRELKTFGVCVCVCEFEGEV